ncbi:MAG: HAD-IG family 5'-nucleotidase [Bdellovibrionaceae bacterium]|nr:HAD-IG family 5'-nucleotidase [Pseudobdellovibrionaceae bacterium]
MPSKVYINRTLNMKKISHIGLDMDHTLVRYNSVNFETLAYKTMLQKLVSVKSYPDKILNLKFNYDDAIRGLVVDKINGNLLKLSRFGAIRQSHHGTKKIDFSEQNKFYKSTYIDLGDPEYISVDTSFSISYATLYAQLVDFKDQDPLGVQLPKYHIIADDLNSVLDAAHRDGSIKDVVANHLSEYIVKDEELVRGIERYLKHSKKFFIVTNSEYDYTKLLLDYAINPFLKKGETWKDLFFLVVTAAQKPRFFYDSLSFLKIDPQTAWMSNIGTKKITSGIYQGGCARRLTDDLGLNPDEILYVGDHIYGDILRLKKDCSWRTALIVEEIADEVEKLHKSKPVSDIIANLMTKKIPLERELDKLISLKIENNEAGVQTKIDQLLQKINLIDSEVSPLIKEQNQLHNKQWGELMRVGIEESYFAYQVERFACIYMSRLSHMLEISPRAYYRAPKRLMAHDMEL